MEAVAQIARTDRRKSASIATGRLSSPRPAQVYGVRPSCRLARSIQGLEITGREPRALVDIVILPRLQGRSFSRRRLISAGLTAARTRQPMPGDAIPARGAHLRQLRRRVFIDRTSSEADQIGPTEANVAEFSI